MEWTSRIFRGAKARPPGRATILIGALAFSHAILPVEATSGPGASADYLAAEGKLQAVLNHSGPQHSRVILSAPELTAYAAGQAQVIAPGAIRQTRLSLESERVTGSAMVDFLKLKQTQTKEPPGWFWRSILAGERPVTIVARLQSAKGRARVDVERIEIAGFAVEGDALDFLIEHFLRASFPYATVGEWFELQHNVESFQVSPGKVTIVTN